MTGSTPRFEDPDWPRASAWLGRASAAEAELIVHGVPTSVASISPSQAWQTPAAFRDVLAGFSTFDGERVVDLAGLATYDAGDLPVADLDMEASQALIRTDASALDPTKVHAFIGGDNAITRPLLAGLAGAGGLDRVGFLTLDAHHDVRRLDQGPRNGTPVRGLIEDGLPGRNVVQVGIHSFANSATYRRWCDDHGIRTVTMADVEANGIEATIDEALGDLLDHTEWVYVDVDVDVLDRAYAPACPGARPGGMHPRQLAAAAYRCGLHHRVRAVDFVEVDASADPDQGTLMAMATAFLAFASGMVTRKTP